MRTHGAELWIVRKLFVHNLVESTDANCSQRFRLEICCQKITAPFLFVVRFSSLLFLYFFENILCSLVGTIFFSRIYKFIWTKNVAQPVGWWLCFGWLNASKSRLVWLQFCGAAWWAIPRPTRVCWTKNCGCCWSSEVIVDIFCLLKKLIVYLRYIGISYLLLGMKLVLIARSTILIHLKEI